jgi:DNA-binding NarL/FixJ family response regulator
VTCATVTAAATAAATVTATAATVSTACPDPARWPRVYLYANDGMSRIGVLALLRLSGLGVAAAPDASADTVVVAAADSADDALEACPEPWPRAGRPTLLVARTFTPDAVIRALQAGVYTMFCSTDAAPRQFAAAVRAAQRGECRMPYGVMVRLLSGPGAGAHAASAPPPASRPAEQSEAADLTARQTAVLTLVADGHGNAAIARTLSCSEHTVKNAIYDLTSRLHVRNRAHAVASAVRRGLI